MVLLDFVGWLLLLFVVVVVELLRVAVLVWPLRISFFGREFTWLWVVVPLRLLPKERVAAGWFCIEALLRVPACLSVGRVAADVGLLPFLVSPGCTVRPRLVDALPGRVPPLTAAADRDEPPWLIPLLLADLSLATPLADVRRRP